MVIAATLLGLGLLFYSFGPKEPRYEGRSLSDWLNELDSPQPGNGIVWDHISVFTSEDQVKAQNAIRHMGPEVIPYLLNRFESRDSVMKQRLISFAEQHPNWPLPIKSAAKIARWKAAVALNGLGEDGKSAIPQLKKYLADPATSKEAAFALAGLGPDGVTVLVDELKSKLPVGSWSKFCVVWSFGGTPVREPRVVETLLTCAQDPDVNLRAMALWALGEIKLESARVTPVLAAALNDTNALIKSTSARALKEMNPAAAKAAGLK